VQVVLHSPDSIAPVGVLHPTAFHIEHKQPAAPDTANTYSSQLASQQQQQQQGTAVIVEVPDDWQPAASPAAAADAADSSSQLAAAWTTDVQITVSQAHIHIICSASSKQQQLNTSAAAAEAAADVQALSSSSLTAADTAAALGAALSAVAAQMPQHGLTWLHSCFVHLYLADMAHFGTANAVYCRHLPQVDPPSRACVQVRREILHVANDINVWAVVCADECNNMLAEARCQLSRGFRR
jgi:diphthine-ammonia ligase